jgi:hypothetical protein
MGYEFMQTALYYLSYPISFVLYYLTAPSRMPSGTASEKSPRSKKKMFILVTIVVIVIMSASVIIVQFFVHQQYRQNPDAPNVRFITFEVDKQEIAVGESTNVLINVQSSEGKVIDNAKVVMTLEPSGYEPYVSISNSPLQLPVFLGKDARTGEVNISISATSSPAKEAVYVVKGAVFVNDVQTDIKEFPLTIRQ